MSGHGMGRLGEHLEEHFKRGGRLLNIRLTARGFPSIAGRLVRDVFTKPKGKNF